MSQKRSKKRLKAARLRAVIKYFTSRGEWRWRLGRQKAKAGTIAGHRRRDGRLIICVDGTSYYASRLAWLYMKGDWPSREIDHRDLDKTNERWRNLRHATHAQNQSNSRARRHNRSGLKGVSAVASGRFQAKIQVAGKTKHLGYFKTAARAHAVYRKAAVMRHGKFARTA